MDSGQTCDSLSEQLMSGQLHDNMYGTTVKGRHVPAEVTQHLSENMQGFNFAEVLPQQKATTTTKKIAC